MSRAGFHAKGNGPATNVPMRYAAKRKAKPSLHGKHVDPVPQRLRQRPKVMAGRVGVWACGRVGVWVCGCVGVWVCGCVGVWVCGCVGVWVRVCVYI